MYEYEFRDRLVSSTYRDAFRAPAGTGKPHRAVPHRQVPREKRDRCERRKKGWRTHGSQSGNPWLDPRCTPSAFGLERRNSVLPIQGTKDTERYQDIGIQSRIHQTAAAHLNTKEQMRQGGPVGQALTEVEGSETIREDLEDEERWFQSLRREPHVSSAKATLRPTEYLITAFTVEREENNAPDQHRMASLENALLCVYLVLLIALVGASLALR
ncbi:hypothetical protein ALC62_07271 [Cyphomyrmex costatus]|uniref:Uncharacterized protein n=1 Tax=Cyphomyrmex costatus TaxID=456900 RepID=A0A195CMN3_9HYME|nr:hypothetical protein ALC62_07271 [Cyphomyrmex costatus]